MANMEYTKDGAVVFSVPNNWTEVMEPVLFGFEKPGDKVMGVLLELKNEKIEGREVLTARLEQEDGGQVKIRPSFDLRQKLGRRMLGRKLLIVFDTLNETTIKKEGDNAMKVFRVFVAPVTGATEPPFVPTDADMPENF